MLASCADYEELYSNDADYNSYGYEYSHTSAYAESKYKWEDFPEYTAKLPKPDFSLGEGIALSVAGVLTPTFVSDNKAALADLTVYLQKLTESGFENTVTNSDEENYRGIVCKNGKAVLDYTYKNHVIILTLYGVSEDTDVVD